MDPIPHVSRSGGLWLQLSILFIGILIIPALLPLSALCLFSWFARKIVSKLAKLFRPDLTHLVDDLDIPYVVFEEPKVNILKHFICDGQVQLDYLRRQFHQRIINHCDPDGNLKYRKLRQTWTQFGGYMFWKGDPDFDLHNHVRLYDYTEPELAIPSPCTEQDLKRLTGSLMSKPYSTPCQWEMLLIPEYTYIDDSDGQRRTGSVLVLKIHHGIADGLSIVKLFIQLFDIRLKKFPTPSFPQLSPLRRFMRLAVSVIKFPFDLAHVFVNSHDNPSSWQSGDRELRRRYLPFCSDRIPMATIKAIKNKCGVGYNTVVYSIAAGAVSRLMKETGQEVPKCMTTLVPYPLPNHPGGLVNHVSVRFFTFSPSIQNPAFGLREIASQIKDPASLPTRPIAILWFWKILYKLPIPALRSLTSSQFSIIMTSYPMFEGPVEIMEGVQIRDIIPALGHFHGTCGASAFCLTGTGNLRILLAVDQLMFQGYTIPQNFNELVNKEVDELWRAADVNSSSLDEK